MPLTYNEKHREFVLVTNDTKKAQKAGLTRSKTATGKNGEAVFFTDVNYAALCFWNEADEKARQRLHSLRADYESSWAKTANFDVPCPEGKEYMPFQLAGVKYAAERQHSLIGDSMGLGKTMQAIGLANYLDSQKTLIVCPGGIRLNWRKKILDWSTLKRPTTYPILRSRDGVNPYANYVIVSYDLLRNEGIHAALCASRWDLIVFDEIHYLKTTDSKRTQASFGGGRSIFKDRFLSSHGDRILGLTGTPLPNRPRECYTVARALDWEAIDWMSYDKFCYRFNPSARVGSGKKVKNLEMKGRLPELQARLRCNFMVRRLKEDVLEDLPDKRYELTYVEPNGPIREVLAKERLIDFHPEELKDPFSDIWGQVATVRREMGEAKVPRVVEHLKYLLTVEELPKVVVFSYHRSVMNYLRAKLHNFGVVEVRGGMSTTQKQQSVDDFVSDPDCRIFSGQITAAGTGIDELQKVASYVVFAEPDWVPGVNEQAIDRLYRIGQHSNVVAQFVIVEGSFDERVLASMFGKTHDIHSSLDEI